MNGFGCVLHGSGMYIRRREECALGLESLRIGKKREEVTQKESNARYPSS